MNELQRFVHYSDFKREMDKELNSLADNVVRIGYLLKQARDTDVLRESGYNSVADFAKAEYNMSPDAVSRYIHINDRFSEGGYSERLDTRYFGFGYTKLADMLALPDALAEAVPVEATREEIRELAKEVKEEQKVTDLELLMETPQAEAAPPEPETMLAKVLKEEARQDVGRFLTLCSVAADGSPRDAYEALAPAGVIMDMVRIPGVGRMALAIKSLSEPVTLTNVRENTKTAHSWEEVLETIRQVFAGEDKEEIYRSLYDVEMPAEIPEPTPEAGPEPESEPEKKEPFAPAQKKPEKKKAKKEKEKKVRISTSPKKPEPLPMPEPAPAPEPQEEAEPAEKEPVAEVQPEPVEAEIIEETDAMKELLAQLNRIRVRILSHHYALAKAEARLIINMLEEQSEKEMREREDELANQNATEGENETEDQDSASREGRAETEETVGEETAEDGEPEILEEDAEDGIYTEGEEENL